MTDEERKQLNIFQRLSAITAGITRVAKNLNVGTGKTSDKAVGEADVLAAVKPLEAEYGVYSYPCKRDIVESGEIINKTDYGDKRQTFMRLKTVYRFVNMDNTAEYVDIDTYGDGIDTNDKAPGKAMTYADKYALLKAYKIETGDDPDQDPSGDGKSTYKKNKVYRCAECGAEMTEELYNKTLAHYGVACCSKECKERLMSSSEK